MMGYGYSIRLIRLNKSADRKLLGVRLGKLCIQHDVPVSSVATKLGVSRQTVYNWFIGTTSPNPSLALRIEKFINLIK